MKKNQTKYLEKILKKECPYCGIIYQLKIEETHLKKLNINCVRWCEKDWEKAKQEHYSGEIMANLAEQEKEDQNE